MSIIERTLDSNAKHAESDAVAIERKVTELYEQHRMEIFRFLIGQGLDSAKAQELAQDVFVRLFIAIKGGKRIESELAWLYGVASKVAVDYWRHEGRPMWVELDASPALVDSLRFEGPSPETATVRNQRLARVAAALAQLPKEQRLGIHLRLQGLRYRVIAKILGMSVSSTASLVSTAVERLWRAANE